MTAALDISEALIRECITRGVTEVFRTMLGRDLTLCAQVGALREGKLPAGDQHRAQVVGIVGFTGGCNGVAYLSFDLPLARACACQLLGLAAKELDDRGDEAINGAIGELTNMTLGSFKNGLQEAGYACKLTIPSILRGSRFSVDPIASSVRRIYHFDHSGHRLVADILTQDE